MIVRPKIEAHAEQLSTPEPTHLRDVAAATSHDNADAYMMVGPLEAELLAIMIIATNARRVLEIGTFTGYSALAMAAALPPGGAVVTCENDADHLAAAYRNIGESPYADRVHILAGDATQTLTGLTGEPFDLIFIDGAKADYPTYLSLTVPLLARSGMIIADNTLHLGRVADASDDPDIVGLQEFNRRVRDDPRLRQVVLTVRQGITLIMRAERAAGAPGDRVATTSG